MTELYDARDSVKNIVDAIAAMLEVDIVIVDHNCMTIVGTGMFNKISQTCVYDRVMSGGNSSMECLQTDDGEELMAICSPIIKEKQVIGVIGIGVSGEAARATFVDKRDTYLNYLDKMAKNLSNTKKELEMIINTMDRGIINVDSTYSVTMCNLQAGKLLDLEEEIVLMKNFDFVFPAFEIGKVFAKAAGYKGKNITFYRGNKKYDLIVSALPVIVENECSGTVLIIDDFLAVKKAMHKVLQDSGQNTFAYLYGQDENFLRVINDARKAAKSDSTILITGESGTGKELFARAIHEESQRRTGLFVAVNCASIPEALLESELFGYEEGAFTGAKRGGKIGKFEMAAGGTLFLDEIGDMPLYLQAKLLRVIQEKKVVKLGGIDNINLDLRIIAATNKDLEKQIKKELFRDDLYYRLNVIPLHLPPLRERKNDIVLLAQLFLNKYNRITNKNIKGFEDDVKRMLLQYHWPGNVRELENLIEYGVNFEKGLAISRNTISGRLNMGKKIAPAAGNSLKEMLEECERNILADYLSRYGESVEAKLRIARELKISKSSLYRKLSGE